MVLRVCVGSVIALVFHNVGCTKCRVLLASKADMESLGASPSVACRTCVVRAVLLDKIKSGPKGGKFFLHLIYSSKKCPLKTCHPHVVAVSSCSVLGECTS